MDNEDYTEADEIEEDDRHEEATSKGDPMPTDTVRVARSVLDRIEDIALSM